MKAKLKRRLGLLLVLTLLMILCLDVCLGDCIDGDLDCSGTVDIFDLVLVAQNFGKTSGFDTRADAKKDGRIDIFDLVLVAQNFGKIGVISCKRPYSDDSPWNTKIGPNPEYHQNSDELITALEGLFGCNPYMYAYPVYEVSSSTTLKTLKFSGTFSDVSDNGNSLNRISGGGTVNVPISEGAQQSSGTDGQIIIVNVDTGDEWGFWQASQDSDTSWKAVNGYHYNINWDGVPPDGFMSRGTGVTYLAGLIRKCEVEQGYIDHAVAFAYDYPCSKERCAAQGFPYYMYPATKSDGKGTHQYDFPEGTRLQLRPDATEAEITNWCGSDNTCRIIVTALQEYGMYTIDNSGHPKIYAEDGLTADWGDALTANTVSKIPYSAFRVLN